MKKIVLPLIGIAMSFGILQAQTDTMYIMKSGIVLGKFKTTEIDSIVF